MKLVVMSRKEIESSMDAVTGGEVCAAICIAYPDGRLHRVRRFGSLWRVHHSRFSDCDADGRWRFPDNKTEEASPFPMMFGMALDIVEFARTLPPEIEKVYVACYGGVSRSRGVALGLAAVFGWDATGVREGGDPNPWCEDLIVRAARLRLDGDLDALSF